MVKPPDLMAALEASLEKCGAEQVDPDGIGEPHRCVRPKGHDGYHDPGGRDSDHA